VGADGATRTGAGADCAGVTTRDDDEDTEGVIGVGEEGETVTDRVISRRGVTGSAELVVRGGLL